MMDFIIIHSADELLTINDFSANYRLACDIDLAGRKFAPIGTEKKPFKGSFDGDGFTVKNVTIDAGAYECVGFFGVNEGNIYDLFIENLSISGTAEKAETVGTIAGLNYGAFGNVHVTGGNVEITCGAGAGTLIIGGICGENHDEIRNCSSAADIKISTTGMKVMAGGICGLAEYGFLETDRMTGKFAAEGPEKLISAALFCCKARNVLTRANKFYSPMNTVNGKVFTKCFISEKEVIHDGNTWRDNRNDDSFLPEAEKKVRKIVTDHMRLMAAVKWTPDTDMQFETPDEKRTQVFPAGETQTGMPLTDSNMPYEAFKACFDSKGNLQPWIRTKGFDGLDLYMGLNDLQAVYRAWQKVTDKVKFNTHMEILPGAKRGTIPVKGYYKPEYDGMNTAQMWEAFEGFEAYDAYANCHAGDAIVEIRSDIRHVRMIVDTPVVIRNEAGEISGPHSYITVIEQARTENGDDLSEHLSKTWAVDRKMPFQRCRLRTSVPVTINAFKKAEVKPAKISVKTPDLVEKPSEFTEIRSAYDLLCITDMEGSYRLTQDIDLGEAVFTPLGTKEAPFRGVFDGNHHHIRHLNVRLDGPGAFGFTGVNCGTIMNLHLDDVHFLGTPSGKVCAGVFAGVNRGRIYGAFGEGGLIEADGITGEIAVGTFAGVNFGNIINGHHEASIRLEGDADIYAGGFTGKTLSGTLETLQNDGEIVIRGDKNRIFAGTYSAVLENCLVRKCIFNSSWNTVCGKLFLKPCAKKEKAALDGNIWRDNRNEDRLLSRKKLDVRGIVEQHMRRMGSVAWTPDKTLTHTCTCLGRFHEQTFPAGVTQYGIPYSHHCGSYERFMACFDENGNLQPWVKTSGYDGWDLYIGNDCSMAVYFALSRITGNLTYEWTWTGVPVCGKGTVPIEGYDAMCSDLTNEIIEKNGKQVMAEAFAKQHIGDYMVHAKNGSGHFRMVAKNAVIYRFDDGKIDIDRSYAITHEQGDGLLYNPQKGPSRSWLLFEHYTLKHLFTEEFIPLTLPELQKGEIMPAEVKYTPGNGLLLPVSGKVESNYRIISVTTAVSDAEGKELVCKQIFPDVHGYEGHGNDDEAGPIIHNQLDRLVESGNIRPDHLTRLKKEYNMRKTIKEVDLGIFAPYFNQAAGLKHGETYHYSLDVLLTNGKTYRVCDADFTYR